MKDAVYINNINCVSPLGFDLESNWSNLLLNNSGIQLHKNLGNLSNINCSKIDKNLFENFATNFDDSENFKQLTYLEKLCVIALKPILNKEKINSKTAFIFSTTKGNIDHLTNELNKEVYLNSFAQKVLNYFQINSNPIIVSNACVSGIYAVALAKRLIKANLYENAYIIAGDIVSEFVTSGFYSFQAISDEPCTPYDLNRKGVSLGEASAAVFISKEKQNNSIEILGDGAINDANHISGPSRTGEGLHQSIEAAFKEAGISKNEIDFISAHGTATIYNDEMEAIAFNRSEIAHAPLNSMKGYFGHTLGASGLLETVISCKSALENTLLPSLGYKELGTSMPISIIEKNTSKPISTFIKTASGFGGSNTAVIFKKL